MSRRQVSGVWVIRLVFLAITVTAIAVTDAFWDLPPITDLAQAGTELCPFSSPVAWLPWVARDVPAGELYLPLVLRVQMGVLR